MAWSFQAQAQTEEIFDMEDAVSPIGEDVQTNDIADMEEKIFIVTEVMPEFPGGEEARMKFLRDNLIYPSEMMEKGIGGRVIVSFVVEKDGSITNIEVVKSVHELLDAEAVRVIKLMPKWTHAIHIGKHVRVRFRIPINFTLK